MNRLLDSKGSSVTAISIVLGIGVSHSHPWWNLEHCHSAIRLQCCGDWYRDRRRGQRGRCLRGEPVDGHTDLCFAPPMGGDWGAPTLLSALNDKGGVSVACDDAGTFVASWNDAAGNVKAVTVPSGMSLSSATQSSFGSSVGTGPSRRLLVVPGKAVLWTAAGISTEAVN